MKNILAVGSLLVTHFSFSQTNLPSENKPKLIVGIVVDQMRYDLLWRFWDLYGNDGFKKLVNEGFLCENTRYNYFLTTTAPGHASIYCGTTPAMHGIVDNGWYDRNSGQVIYVVSDTSAKTIGNPTSVASASPFRLMSSTITDELKLADANSKVFGIALKDRSAIMPAGHFPDGSFWYDSKTGNWITSTWYKEPFPLWLKEFNEERKVENYLEGDWMLMFSPEKYTMATNDTVEWENNLPGETLPVFPHKLGAGNFSQLPYSPFGNTMTKDIAIAAIKNEDLGKGNATDFLCVSFSSPDIIAHQFGSNSLEIADCYARLDRDLAEMLKVLDERVGKENVLVFLTADHGGAINPTFAGEHHLNGGYMQADSMRNDVNKFLSTYFGAGEWVIAMMDQQVYLNQSLIATTKFSEHNIAKKVEEFLLAQEGILCVLAPKFDINTCASYVTSTIMNGYMPSRSGDILFSVAPGWIDWFMKKGTTHGSVYAYDNHVPLLWYGWQIAHGSSAEPVFIPDIAPTISNWLHIAFPSGCTGNPITTIPLNEE